MRERATLPVIYATGKTDGVKVTFVRFEKIINVENQTAAFSGCLR